MSQAMSWGEGRLVELDPEECWSLLAARSVGRIAFEDGHGPCVLPVNHVAGDGKIRFKTSPYGVLAGAIDGQRVAFEVDDVDDFHSSGWSVLMRGRATLLEASTWGAADDPAPWPEGQHPLLVEIEPTEVSGRRLMGSA